MEIKKIATKLSIVLSVGILTSTYTIPSVSAFSSLNSSNTMNGITVDVKQIKDLVEGANKFGSDPGNEFGNPTQNLAHTAAALVTADDDRSILYDVSGEDVLRYLYPNDTSEQLQNESVSPEQVQDWLKHMGYTSTLIQRPLTTSEIKANLDEAEPAIAVLEGQNKADWINSETSAVIYAHNDISGVEDEVHATFLKTLNYGEYMMNDGTEGGTIQFPEMADNPDQVQRDNSFKWTKTISDIKKDPSWHNDSAIEGNRAEGTFNVTITHEGNDVVASKFTDADVISLPGKYAKDNPAPGMKLNAVALINLYFDKNHQQTVDDIDRYLEIGEKDDVTSQQVQDWYHWLGFTFDTLKGKITKDVTKKSNSEGKLYLSFFNRKDTGDGKKESTAIIGTGFNEDTTAGYDPIWKSAKDGEGMAVGYNLDMSDPSTAFAKLEAAKRAFDYDSIIKTDGQSNESTEPSVYFDADVTLYNIKYNPEQTSKSNETSSNKAERATTVKVTPKYTTAPDFKVRETQGQQPWCAEYVAAAAINTVYKAKDTVVVGDGAVTTAKTLMQKYFPGTSDEDLEKMGGGTVQDSLDTIKKEYNVTADVVDRKLSFEEVKKEIDNDKIIELDADEVDVTPGFVDDTGHAMAIVGYVVPSDGNTADHAPYYEVWNPWWQKYFYISANSDTIKLAGTTFEWNRTWYNWRKVAGNASVNVDPKIGQQKVATNAISTKTPKSSFNTLNKSDTQSLNIQKISNWNKKDSLVDNSLMDSPVSHMSAPVKVFAPGFNDHFGYSQSKDKSKMKAWWNDKTPKVAPATRDTPITNFADDVDDLIDLGGDILEAVGGNWSSIVLVLTIAATVPEAAGAVTVLQSLGVLGGVDLMFVVKTSYSYITTVHDLKSEFNNIKNG